MKKIFIVLAVLMVLLLAGCGIPQEVQDQIAQLEEANEQLGKANEQLEIDKKQWEEVDKPALEKRIEELSAERDELQAELDKVPKLLRNPSDKKELADFLDRDETNTKQFSYPSYHSLDFALDLKIHAEAEGIRVALVALVFPKADQFLNAFEVEGKLIYIEPQLDQEVTVRLNESYRAQNGRPPKPIDDTILRVRVYW